MNSRDDGSSPLDVIHTLLRRPRELRRLVETLYDQADGKWLAMLEVLSDLGLQCLKAEAEQALDDCEIKGIAERARQQAHVDERIRVQFP